MHSVINREGRDALYQQIAADLRDGITGGKYAPGARLPSETDLMNTHGVARLTARRARRVLRDEGLVEIIPGRGAFVAAAA